ncbi:MAG TPA: hypothetical protein PKZ36_02100 [Candidatus Paceibacterota bacterium]|nr:hypothetical protein [Candidatus Paceibacterota bacterium]HPT18179.1 hypothetical protein [Candidatus Paceibacterota bacterium]
MKDLNKSQLVLLTILISFITSIATGISTVSLLQQAPVSFTAPINRIVRQTVEKIVPGESSVQTVVVKEEDLVVDAIAKNQSTVFAISKDSFDEFGNSIEVSAGRGFAVSNDGIIVADSLQVTGYEKYYVKNDNGKFNAEFISADKKGFSFLKIGKPIDEKSKLVYTVPASGDLGNMKAGQKIILLGSTISSFIYEGSKDLKITVNKTNAGGILLDIDGNVLGIALSNETISFASIADILSSLKSLNETPKA